MLCQKLAGSFAFVSMLVWEIAPGFPAQPNERAGVTVTAEVQVVSADGARLRGSEPAPETVIWLTPMNPVTLQTVSDVGWVGTPHFRLDQQGKRFDPHVLIVPAGALVEFPNHDPVFHNVFSFFEGKRFDLGLYESGAKRVVSFNRPGICYVFCNIHPEMSAVVIVMATPYYTTAREAGSVMICNVPAGRYRLQVWHERSNPDFLRSISREITISPENTSLGTLKLVEAARFPLEHKNKYGRDYDTPTSREPLYSRP